MLVTPCFHQNIFASHPPIVFVYLPLRSVVWKHNT